MRASPTLVFDLDGTLSDPVDGIGRSINHALGAYGFAPLPPSAVSPYIGPPLDQAFAAITGASADVIKKLVATYRERYADVGYAENMLYPGIPEALAALAAQGCRLGVCTSKRVDFAERILQLFDLRGCFAFVDGGDIGIHKTQQLQSLRTTGVIGAGSVMIGDRSMDVAAAQHNGLRSAGVLWGHGTHAELTAAGADILLASVAELSTLAGYLRPQLSPT